MSPPDLPFSGRSGFLAGRRLRHACSEHKNEKRSRPFRCELPSIHSRQWVLAADDQARSCQPRGEHWASRRPSRGSCAGQGLSRTPILQPKSLLQHTAIRQLCNPIQDHAGCSSRHEDERGRARSLLVCRQRPRLQISVSHSTSSTWWPRCGTRAKARRRMKWVRLSQMLAHLRLRMLVWQRKAPSAEHPSGHPRQCSQQPAVPRQQQRTTAARLQMPRLQEMSPGPTTWAPNLAVRALPLACGSVRLARLRRRVAMAALAGGTAQPRCTHTVTRMPLGRRHRF